MNEPGSHFQVTTAIVRLFDTGVGYGEGTPTLTAFVTRLDHDTCKIEGVMRCPTPAQFRALKRLLIHNGFKRATWERWNRTGFRSVTFAPKVYREED